MLRTLQKKKQKTNESILKQIDVHKRLYAINKLCNSCTYSMSARRQLGKIHCPEACLRTKISWKCPIWIYQVEKEKTEIWAN